MPEYPIAENYSLETFLSKGGVITYGTLVLENELRISTPTDPLFVIEIAPATSLGAIIQSNSTLSKNAVVVAMSGSIFVGYGNSSLPSKEYNVYTDITASQYVYNASWLYPLCMAPLDTTIFDQFNGGTYANLLKANTSAHPFVVSILNHYEVWYANGGSSFYAILPFSPLTGTSTMYDVQVYFCL